MRNRSLITCGLITCGLFAVACSSFAQNCQQHDHGYPDYQPIVPYPYDDCPESDFRGNRHSFRSRTHAYHGPHSQCDEMTTHQEFRHSDFQRSRLGVSDRRLSPFTGRRKHRGPCSEIPTRRTSFGPKRCDACGRDFSERFGWHDQHNDYTYRDSGRTYPGSHDPLQTHGPDDLAPLPDPSDRQRFRDRPNRDRMMPYMQTPSRSDLQPMMPPSLGWPSTPAQADAPLGDSPPPATVPLSSVRQRRALQFNGSTL